MTSLPNGVKRAFRIALRRPHIERDVDDEVAFHLEMRRAELTARGFPPDAALAEAMRRFGNTRKWSIAMSAVDQERIASEQRSEWMDDLQQDLRYALRSFRRSPLFTVLAIVTLALGIGANAAVFGVVKSVLLNALPYSDADRVLRIYSRRLDGTNDRAPLSAGTIIDIRERARSLQSAAAFLQTPQNGVYAASDQAVLVKILRIEPEFFGVLGVSAMQGRTLVPEDAASDTAFNVVLTYSGWQRLLGGETNAIGRKMIVNGISRTVVGILPRQFIGPSGEVDYYMTMSLRPMMGNLVNARMRHNFGMMARIRPGISLVAAQRELTAIAADLAKAYPNENGSESALAMPVRQSLVGDTRTPLLVLMASAALVLVITCANLAGALLSRTITRRKEFAIRAALGAGRGRLVRQLLTESSLLALLGGVLGVALAVAGLGLVRGVAGHALPEYTSLTLDGSALLVTALVALITGLAFGAAPAIAAGRGNPQAALREESRSASESRRSRQLRGVLVAGQIALCVSLLAGAGLLARSLWAMTATPLGFNAENVLTASVYLPTQRYNGGDARNQFTARFLEKLRGIPGVIGAASASDFPTHVASGNNFTIIGAPPVAADAQPIALYMDVSDDYFKVLGIPVRSGRAFNSEDRQGTPLALIINESMARQYFPKGDAVGSRVALGPGANADAFTVVGVVGDVRNDPTRTSPQPVLYLSSRQFPWNGPNVLVRTRGEPTAVVDAVRRAVAEIDPTLPVYDIATLDKVVAGGFAARRLPVVLMTAFGALALLLASVGVYAMFAAMAAAREREFAVRIALGSTRRAIAQLVLRQGAAWMAVGLLLGAIGIVAVSRAVRSLLYGVSPFDPVAFGAAALLLIACGAIALLVPVRRATRVDPNSILR